MRKRRACATSHHSERDELKATTYSAFPIATTRTSVEGRKARMWLVKAQAPPTLQVIGTWRRATSALQGYHFGSINVSDQTKL